MKRFITRLIVFLFPLICFILPSSYILWKSSENFINIDKVILSDNKYLIGYAYDESNYKYIKWMKIIHSEYKVIALGSSRVLQFRDKMFTSSFYNTGYTIENIWDFIPFLENISHLPKYLIIGLDQFMFNEAGNANKIVPNKEKWQKSFNHYPEFSTLVNVWRDVLNSKYNFSLSSSDEMTRIGLNAIVNDKGFRNDGSMYYGDQIYNLIHDKFFRSNLFQDVFDRIKNGNRRFEYGEQMDKNAVKELEHLLEYCQNRHINVIAFLPPFADAVFENMEQTGKYAYMMKIYERVKPVFDSYGFELYDFSTTRLCDSNDDEMIDGFHGGEVTYQKILINMIRKGSILRNVTDIDSLTNDLSKKINNYQIYDN
jgi:hypothetical protein